MNLSEMIFNNNGSHRETPNDLTSCDLLNKLLGNIMECSHRT